jgi:soluble lytic murein transglycosylase-like protein/TolA-binding protein
MYFVSTLLVALFSTLFESSIDRAFLATHNNDWTSAASALDEAFSQDPQTFDANNFHYLRGRVAENQNDWVQAREEFNKISPENPLRPLAVWHALRASARLGDQASAEQLFALLPREFPSELKMQIAREAGGPIALKIYQDVPTREARLERAKLQNDISELWSLLRENKDDDVALEAARLSIQDVGSVRDQMDAAQVFVNHRQFDEALPLYSQASTDPAYAAEAKYQMGRIEFQLRDYAKAIEAYRGIVKEFPGTNWQKDAEYQIALSYWRLEDYRSSEKAYLEYIRRYGSAGMEESATRNLVDVYRVLGENQKAIQTLDRALMTRLSPATRQILLFTKGKILYSENRYATALPIFQQLGQMRLRPGPGATTMEEAEYFQALSQSKLGNRNAAETIWRKLARNEFSYYGQRAAERLGRSASESSTPACSSTDSIPPKYIEADLASFRHPVRTEMDPSSQPVAELVFLGLWDEAAFWMERSPGHIPTRAAAEISYLGGRYNRSITYADRLPKTESTLALLYPAGYRKTICNAAVAQNVDPLWLHAIIWQESRYNPFARSGAAARGLMQFIPETAHAIAASAGISDLTIDRLYDPGVSIDLGARYWSSLLDQLKSPEMALAAYNGGVDNVEKWKSKSSDPDLFVADIGFAETKKYVMSVFAARAAYGSLLKNAEIASGR